MAGNLKTSILIAEDQVVVRLGLQLMLKRSDSFEVVGEAADGKTAVELALKLKPNIVLMDIQLPVMNGADATWYIKRELPQTRILVFTTIKDSDTITSVLGYGADGFCLKDSANDHLISALHAIDSGDKWIDPSLAKLVVENREGASGLSDTENRIRCASDRSFRDLRNTSLHVPGANCRNRYGQEDRHLFSGMCYVRIIDWDSPV